MSIYNDSSLLCKLKWDPSGLKTMANTIKSILEQGVLLEQVLINHKNRILEKKANKDNVNIEANDSSIISSSFHPLSNCSVENQLNEKSVNNLFGNQSSNSINEMGKSETESHTSNSDSLCTNKPLDRLVKLVDQSLLMDSNVNSAVSVSDVTQFVTASSNALKNSLSSTDDNLIQPDPITSCADGKLTSDSAVSDLHESDGTHLSNVNKYPNALTQNNQYILLPNSTQNSKSSDLLPFNLISIKREENPPVMPPPILVKVEQKQVDSGLVENCLQLNTTTSDNIYIDNVSTDGNCMDSEVVNSVDVLNNIDFAKTAPPNAIYISSKSMLTEEIVLQFFNNRGIEVTQFRRMSSNNFNTGIVLLKHINDVKRVLPLNRKFLINGAPLSIKKYFVSVVQKASRCTKGKNNKTQVTAAKSTKKTEKKKQLSGPSKNDLSKKNLRRRDECKSNMNNSQIRNICDSPNVQNPLNLPETSKVQSSEFAKCDNMQSESQVEIHPNKECIDRGQQSNSCSSYRREQGKERYANRQSLLRRQQSKNNHFSNNYNPSYEKFKRQHMQKQSNYIFDSRQNRLQNQRRGTDQHYYNNRDNCDSQRSQHREPN